MGKDTRLINIYLKIHNKKTLTMDDLDYLAEFDPEFFAKTCKNVVYNIPEAKPIIESAVLEELCDEAEPESFEWQSIERILESLKSMQISDFPVTNIDTDEVKNLLGNLYMEMLFPHNDKYAFMDMSNNGNSSLFDKRA